MDQVIKVGIMGGAGYTGGELIRLLIHHPQVSINFVHSKSNAGKPVHTVHQDLIGSTTLVFADQMNDNIDVLFLCFGHGESKKFLTETTIPEHVKIIDLANDFRLTNDATIGSRTFTYGLPELNLPSIQKANNIANPGCFATAIQLGLLPLAAKGLVTDVYTTGITGSTGAGQSLATTSHFSWRANNIQAYKTLSHQHLKEIHQSLEQAQKNNKATISFVPWRGDFTRGIFVSSTITSEQSLEEIYQLYETFYADAPFTIVSRDQISLKQVINTNKCLIHLEKENNKLVVHSAIDNLLKGASGQAIENMNIMFSIEEQPDYYLNHLLSKFLPMELFNVYPINDINITHALGSRVWDDAETEYLDMYGGHAVISIGHQHPHWVNRIKQQLDKISFYSNSIKIPLQQELADKLGKLSGKEDYALFLCNSGAEANENALKLASFHTGRKKIIAFKKAFHGRTSLAVAATDNPSIIAPVNETNKIIFLPFNDEESLKTCFAQQGNEIAAVIIEGIQGVGGINVATSSFLHSIRTICDEHGAIYIADSVQCGYGRSGYFFSHDHAGVTADIYTMAKGMGNGFPIGGIIISPKIPAKHFMLGTTFGGNHLACAAAIAVLEVIENENLMDNAKEIGNHLMEELKQIPEITNVRGMGLMIGFDVPEELKLLKSELLHQCKIFTGEAKPNVIRLLPSLALTMEDAEIFLASLKKAIAHLQS